MINCRLLRGLPLAVGLLSVTVGCGGGGGVIIAGPSGFFVDALSGSDLSSGSVGSPWKSITYALSQIVACDTLNVQPGLYDTANGELFPIIVPDNVSLIGNEALKGKGPVETLIQGGALSPDNLGNNLLWAALNMGTSSEIAGLVVDNDEPLAGDNSNRIWGLVIGANSDAVIRNCCFRNSQSGGIYIFNNTQNHVIIGNEITSNGNGIAFINGGIGTRVETNVITNNAFGVLYDSAGGDLGGGAAGSVGGNVFSCNGSSDLWTNQSSITINAQNCFWDHVAPSGNDIFNPNGATIDTTGAMVAPNNCP